MNPIINRRLLCSTQRGNYGMQRALVHSFMTKRAVSYAYESRSVASPSMARVIRYGCYSGKVFHRNGSTMGETMSFPQRTFLLFGLGSLGVVGFFYTISYSMSKTNIYKESMDIIMNTPSVIETCGTPMKRKGTIKGKLSSGIADMKFMVAGPNGRMNFSVTGTLKKDSKVEYDIRDIDILEKGDNAVNLVHLVDNGKVNNELTSNDASIPSISTNEKDTEANEANEEPNATTPQNYGFLLDKPWYYRIGLAAGVGLVMGIMGAIMVVKYRQAPQNTSAYQSLLVLLKESKIASDILGEGIKSGGQLVGKSEESWANFSIKMQGKKSSAMVNCQAFRQDKNWRFTVVSLDTSKGRVYLCK